MICLGFVVARLFCLTLVTSTKIKGVFCSCLLSVLLVCLFDQVLKFFLNQRSHFSVIVNKFRPESACEVHRVEVFSKVKLCIDSLWTGTKLSQLFQVWTIQLIVVRDYTCCIFLSFFLCKVGN